MKRFLGIIALIVGCATVQAQSRNRLFQSYAPFNIDTQNVLPQTFGAVGDGNHDDAAAINKAIIFCGGNEVAPVNIAFLRGIYRIATTLTVPANIIFVFAPGASLSVDAGVQVRFFSPQGVQAGLWQIFKGAGSVRFMNDSAPVAIYPEWWGAVKQSGDSGLAINAALAAQNGSPVYLTGSYFFATTITANGGRLVGITPNAELRWVGSAAIAMDFTTGSNLRLENFALNNTGLATVGIRLAGQHIRLKDLYIGSIGSHVGFTTAAIATDPSQGSVFDLILRDVKVYSQTAGLENAIGFWLNTEANQIGIHDSFFSGNKVGLKIGRIPAGSDLGANVFGLVIDSTHFEAFGTAPLPGGANAVGIDLQEADAPHIAGIAFEMLGDSGIGGAGDLCLKCAKVRGGSITDSTIRGNGAQTNAIAIVDSDCVGFGIDHNYFHNLNTDYAIILSGSGAIANVDVGDNIIDANTLGVFNGVTVRRFNGAITARGVTTGSRPNPSGVPIGTQIWNTSTKKVNISDGTNWYDAIGNLAP